MLPSIWTIKALTRSSSSRRTWIEMWTKPGGDGAWLVVLLAEDVDRNRTPERQTAHPPVVLLAEDVDRNR